MAGFSEVIQTIGAIIIFSLILLTSNRMILSNSMKEVESEAEGIAVTLAQNIIEEAQTKAFDEATTDSMVPMKTPEEFSTFEDQAAEGESSRKDFDDFDDYDALDNVSFDSELGNDTFKLDVDVAYVSAANNYDIDKGSKTNPTHFKKMRVTVESQYLDNEVQLEYLQRYFKTKN